MAYDGELSLTKKLRTAWALERALILPPETCGKLLSTLKAMDAQIEANDKLLAGLTASVALNEKLARKNVILSALLAAVAVAHGAALVFVLS